VHPAIVAATALAINSTSVADNASVKECLGGCTQFFTLQSLIQDSIIIKY